MGLLTIGTVNHGTALTLTLTDTMSPLGAPSVWKRRGRKLLRVATASARRYCIINTIQ